MNIFVTADLHLGHDAIRRHCSRPFATVEEMDEALIANWNRSVSDRDLVYVVGDFAWRHHDRYLARLKGRKILIRGNHDRMPRESLRDFAELHDLLVRKIGGVPTVLCHYCLNVWPRSPRGSWHLYGHSHGRLEEPTDSPRCDVGVDVWHYAPVPWEAIRIKLEGRGGEPDRSPLEIEQNVVENREQNRKIIEQL